MWLGGHTQFSDKGHGTSMNMVQGRDPESAGNSCLEFPSEGTCLQLSCEFMAQCSEAQLSGKTIP